MARFLLRLSLPLLALAAPTPGQRGWEPAELHPRKHFALAGDTARKRVVLHGGFGLESYFDILAGTWEWDGQRWHRLGLGPDGPGPRCVHAMAFDPVRSRTVLFGGLGPAPQGGAAYLNDTWEWDGRSWQERRPSQSPGIRGEHALAADRHRGRVILFGGYISSGASGTLLGDTWEWDGAAWSLKAQAGPSPRNGPRMAYDPVRRRTLLFGGQAIDPQTNKAVKMGDTWEWDGGSWTLLTPALSPNPRSLHGLAWDPARQRIVLNGGAAFNPVTQASYIAADTWEWDGAAWTDRSAPGGPAFWGGGLGLAEDPAGGRAALVGSPQAMPASAQMGLWAWTGASWQGLWLSAGPGKITDHAMAHDTGRRRCVLFGGTSTWEWAGGEWSLAAASGPSNRRGHAMAFDAAGSRVLLFGGRAPDYNKNDETWAWDGLAWSRLQPAASPPARSAHAMAGDEARGRVVLFGGQGVSTLGDTWEWDGMAWKQCHPASSPPARLYHAMAWDGARGKVVLFGGDVTGSPVLGDTWEWDGTAWLQAKPASSPPARYMHAMAWCPLRRRTVLVGGTTSTTSQAYSRADTWEWDGHNWHAVTPYLSPLKRFDHALAVDPAAGVLILQGGCTDPDSSRTYNPGDTWIYASYNWEAGCPGCACQGPRTPLLCGAGGLIGDQVQLLVTAAPPQAFAVLAVGAAEWSLPFGCGKVCLQPLLTLGFLTGGTIGVPGSGWVHLGFPVPPDPLLAGQRLLWQYVLLDMAHVPFACESNSLVLRLLGPR